MAEARSRSTWDIANEVLRNLKTQITSWNDIIPRSKMPYWYEEEEKNTRTWGRERFDRFKEHQIKTNIVREKSLEIKQFFQAKGIYTETTRQVAVSLCGIGECGETTNRGLIDLTRAGCTQPIKGLLTLGKPRIPFPVTIDDYYEHVFLIIGETPPNWPSKSLNCFKELNNNCILLDISLNIIGKANETNELLREIFKAYEIDRIEPAATLSIDNPLLHREEAKTLFKNAIEYSEKIKQELEKENKETEKKENPAGSVSPSNRNSSDWITISYPNILENYADNYISDLEKIINAGLKNKLIRRDPNGGKVSFSRFWLRQLPDTSINELSQNLFCDKSRLRA